MEDKTGTGLTNLQCNPLVVGVPHPTSLRRIQLSAPEDRVPFSWQGRSFSSFRLGAAKSGHPLLSGPLSSSSYEENSATDTLCPPDHGRARHPGSAAARTHPR